ncbi:MAG TPA: hypothetical protein PKX46_01730 [Clostridia bacterium]|nr:hypothetical protein [Clostridia bacterium]HOR12617.1 hypothetical protein [Clostridia bacterium]
MNEMPEGLLFALSKDKCAMKRFSALDDEKKADVIKKASGALSAQELFHIISRL